jgi:excisionase family DNA binding protein
LVAEVIVAGKELAMVTQYPYRKRRQEIISQEYLSTTQAADFLGVSRRYIEQAAARGELKRNFFSKRLVRISKAELRRYAEEHLCSK